MEIFECDRCKSRDVSYRTSIRFLRSNWERMGQWDLCHKCFKVVRKALLEALEIKK